VSRHIDEAQKFTSSGHGALELTCLALDLVSIDERNPRVEHGQYLTREGRLPRTVRSGDQDGCGAIHGPSAYGSAPPSTTNMAWRNGVSQQPPQRSHKRSATPRELRSTYQVEGWLIVQFYQILKTSVRPGFARPLVLSVGIHAVRPR